MNADQFRSIFPNASKTLLELNLPAPGDLPREVIVAAVTASKPKLRRQPNRTEAELSRILQAKYPDAKIRYESIKLRLGDNCFYTPDFMLSGDTLPRVTFIEAKGGHIWDDAKVKFRAAKEQYPEFDFKMFQKKNGEWKLLIT